MSVTFSTKLKFIWHPTLIPFNKSKIIKEIAIDIYSYVLQMLGHALKLIYPVGCFLDLLSWNKIYSAILYYLSIFLLKYTTIPNKGLWLLSWQIVVFANMFWHTKQQQQIVVANWFLTLRGNIFKGHWTWNTEYVF